LRDISTVETNENLTEERRKVKERSENYISIPVMDGVAHKINCNLLASAV
jgi:hypothetical protein